jgi:hypothetical protein
VVLSGQKEIEREREMEQRITLRPGALLALAVAVMAVAACGTVHPSAPSHSPKAVTTITATPKASPDCATQVVAWRVHGLPQTTAVGKAVNQMGLDADKLDLAMSVNADLSSIENTATTDLGTLQATIQILQNDLPPKCVPQLDADLTSALGSYSASADDMQQALTSISTSDYTSATADIQTVNYKMTTANAELQQAATDVNNFNAT